MEGRVATRGEEKVSVEISASPGALPRQPRRGLRQLSEDPEPQIPDSYIQNTRQRIIWSPVGDTPKMSPGVPQRARGQSRGQCRGQIEDKLEDNLEDKYTAELLPPI